MPPKRAMSALVANRGATAPLAEAPIPERPRSTPARRPTTRRYSVDLDLDRHKAQRRWAMDADVSVSLLWAAVLDLVADDAELRRRIEDRARRNAEAGR